MCNAKDCEQYHSDNTCCTCQNLEWYKLKQTLTEIREIAESFCNACQEFEPEKRGRACIYCNYGKILQKISEAK